MATQDNTQGFKLLRSPPSLPLYTCNFTYADTGRTNSVTIHVTIAGTLCYLLNVLLSFLSLALWSMKARYIEY